MYRFSESSSTESEGGTVSSALRSQESEHVKVFGNGGRLARDAVGAMTLRDAVGAMTLAPTLGFMGKLLSSANTLGAGVITVSAVRHR